MSNVDEVTKALLPPLKMGDEVILKFDNSPGHAYLHDRRGILLSERRKIHHINNVVGAEIEVFAYHVVVAGTNIAEGMPAENRAALIAVNQLWVQDKHVYPLIR